METETRWRRTLDYGGARKIVSKNNAKSFYCNAQATHVHTIYTSVSVLKCFPGSTNEQLRSYDSW